MQVVETDSSGTNSRCRRFIRNDVRWVVREDDCSGVPGAWGTASLVFDSRELIRRAWVFPRNWHELNEIELWAVSERSGRISAKFNGNCRDFSSNLSASLANTNRAAELHARAKIGMAQNRAQRAECRKLAAACRAERNCMREIVETHVNELRTAGLTVEDASHYVASVVRETVAKSGTSSDAAIRLENDTNRWCANAYNAA